MSKKTSVIELYNVAPDLVFLFMYEAMKTVPYDGDVVLSCGNPKETKESFMKWIHKNKSHIISAGAVAHEDHDSVAFWPEENYRFTSGNDPDDPDYQFNVMGQCGSIDYSVKSDE